MPTLGEHLLNEILPASYRPAGALTKGSLNHALVELAKKEPEKYPSIVTKLKQLGDEFATLEGISVGLDDVAPNKKERNGILKPYLDRFHQAPASEKEKILVDAQNAMLAYAKRHPSTMGEMVRSGGRGNAAQLMKIVGAPVLARDDKDRVVPWLIARSYSEGLRPADAWVAGNEARINAIKSNISVVEPGDLSKILIANMGDKLITMADCGTHNGLPMSASNPSVIDRYLARDAGGVKAGTLITPQVAQKLSGSVIVRSPMTCQAPHGVCQKCQGLDPSGRTHAIGTNVGMRAAQAMAEPLTQFALNAKHGGRISTTVDDDEKRLEGIKGVRQILEIPQSFLHKATLAEHDGEVSKVEAAPQGGHYVWVGETRHYIDPSLKVVAPVGKKVEAGDMLSSGIPKPDELVRKKGLGEGRRYLVDALHSIYKSADKDIDRRHLETLARSVLNHVQITDVGEDNDHGFIKGDVVDYNRFQSALAEGQKHLPLHDAVGETLASDVLHYTAGTRVTPSMVDTLTRHGVKSVATATIGPHAEPFMRPASRTPLLNPDWMARLAHRYLKDSLIAGAHKGDRTDLHGFSPVPAYAAGSEFSEGEEGAY